MSDSTKFIEVRKDILKLIKRSEFGASFDDIWEMVSEKHGSIITHAQLTNVLYRFVGSGALKRCCVDGKSLYCIVVDKKNYFPEKKFKGLQRLPVMKWSMQFILGVQVSA